jgi:hypothetical protein
MKKENRMGAFLLDKTTSKFMYTHVMWTYPISKQTFLLIGLEKRQLKLLLQDATAQASVRHHSS